MISKTANFFNKSEGRDKFCKIIQYGSRLGFSTLENISKKESEGLKTLFLKMKDSRKLFRLFKYISEIQKIKDLINNPPSSMDHIEIILNIFQRFGLMLFWFFDNLVILTKLKILKLESKKFLKAGMFFWWYSIIVSIINAIKKLKHINIELKNKYTLINKNPKKKVDFEERIMILKNLKIQIYKTIIKNFGDLITASSGWGLNKKIGLNYGDKLIGFGGLVSSCITCYDLYNN